MRKSTVLLTSFVAVAFTWTAGAQELKRPKRRPEGGESFALGRKVMRSAIGTDGTTLAGTLWLERKPGNKFQGQVVLKNGSDAPVALPDFYIQTDADLDAAGADETIDLPALDKLLVGRAVATSDLALIPLRALLPHLAHFESNEHQSTRELKVIGATVDYTEQDLQSPPFQNDQTQTYFTHIVRRFQPSGFEIHDYVLTFKKKPDDFILASRALRMLVHPSALAKDGKRPLGGVFEVSMFGAQQIDFRDNEPLLDPAEMTKFEARFREKLLDALFLTMPGEGLGDPFDTPAAVAARASGLLDGEAIDRFAKANDLTPAQNAKALAAMAPLVVESKLKYESAAFLKSWRSADDPVLRLLLAAGAAAGGAKNDRFAIEGKLATHSKNPRVLEAALLLGQALQDATIIADATKALGR